MSKDQHWELFKEETFELLADLETSLLELEKTPDNEELIRRAFRTMHTIKGTGGMFGVDGIKTFAHEIETVFELVNQGQVAITQELVDLTLLACDQIRQMLETSGSDQTHVDNKSEQIIVSLQKLILHTQEEPGEDSGLPSLAEVIDPSIRMLLSEKEEYQLMRKIQDNQKIFIKNVIISQKDFDKTLAELTQKLKKEVDLISILPNFDKRPPNTIGFNILFASDKDEGSLETVLGFHVPKSADDKETTIFTGPEHRTEDPSPSASPSVLVIYRIRFRPARDTLKKGTDPFDIFHQLRRLGDLTIVAQTDAIPLLDNLNPEDCYTYWDLILTTSQGIDEIKDVFIFFEDDCDLQIQIIDEAGRLEGQKSYKRLGDILIERGDLTPEDLSKILEDQKPIGQMLMVAGLVHSGQIHSALQEQEHVRKVQESLQKTKVSSSIRVSSEKLDTLVDLVGEMVTVQARLSQMTAFRNDPELLLISEEVERLTGELRDNTMSIRMLPIGATLFSKFKRLVRDLSNELGKEIELTMEGAETELDKTVIEQLNDPLVHLIRNCIDHGIESPEARQTAEKPRHGNIHLSASHSGAHVLIRITDDGAGLDKESVWAKAVENGLLSPDAMLSEKELFSLVFTPGFSTAKSVTSVSGRGVGMDVVKKNIDALRGTIEVDSEKGMGTAITLKLPLTLAIIEGLLVEIGKERFVMPLSIVKECVELTREDAANAHGRHLANVRGEIVPYVRLREQFMIEGDVPEIEQIVIASVDDRRIGFVVDHVIGNHQTVIKTLGRVYKNIDGVSGATILGDGAVALILDVPKLAHHAEQRDMNKAVCEN